jgi:hypothetical protein
MFVCMHVYGMLILLSSLGLLCIKNKGNSAKIFCCNLYYIVDTKTFTNFGVLDMQVGS